MRGVFIVISALMVSCSRSPAVPVAKAERTTFVRNITAEGVLEAEKATPISAPNEAQQALKVSWIADDGTLLKKGDPIVRFDATDFNELLQSGRDDDRTAINKIVMSSVDAHATSANLRRDAAVATLELDAARQFQVNDDEVFSRYQRIESSLDQTLAEERRDYAEDVLGVRDSIARADRGILDIEQRKAAIKVNAAQKGLGSLEVRAPYDGLFVLRRVGNDTTRVGSTIWPGMRVGDIPDLARMKAEIFVLEADAAGLAVGKRARVMLESRPDRVFTGKVTRVDKLARPRIRNVPVQYFGVTVTLDQQEPSIMKPGARIRAVLELENETQAITVPRQSLFEKDGKRVVYVKRADVFAPVAVTTGSSSAGRVVVIRGLVAGDTVALADPAAGERGGE